MKTRDKMIVFCRDALGLSAAESLEITPLRARGSDRAFLRVSCRGASAILVVYDPRRIENAYYADIAGFLLQIGIPAPRVIRHETAASLLLLEDLGGEDLWSYRKAPWKIRGPLYKKTLAVAHRLHSFPASRFPSDRVRLMEPFGPGLYLWERDYFRNYFVREVCGIVLQGSLEDELEAELSSLADRLSIRPPDLVHRDFQSQNVMIRGGQPFLIDFQGLRFGTYFYDIGSLLCDPYVQICDGERDMLLSLYYGLAKRDLGEEEFRRAFWEASAQRLMQALGAYGFLGRHRGLQAFLEHIPAGLHNLVLAASRVESLPRLRELSLQCRGVIKEKQHRFKD